MTRVIHTGDTHVGYRQYHSPKRRQDFLDAFEAVIDDAIDEQVAAVIHAGDLFHDRRPDLPDLLGTISALRRLDEAGVPFLAVVGNHESTRGGQWLDLFERLGFATRLGAEPVTIDDVAFYGLDHVPPSRRDELDYAFEPSDATHNVLVSHGLFTPFAHADWETEEVLSRSTVDFDAVLLGDNHESGTERIDDTWVTYCGSTERASASEETARGYNVVEFDGSIEIRRRSIDTREFRFIPVELDAGDGVEAVHDQVGQYDVEDAVAIVRIDGDGKPIPTASVEERLLDDGAIVARVADNRDRDETEAADLGVEFADPDAAVDERIGELGLSSVGVELDRTIRSDSIVDSNVRETVKERVHEHLEEGPEAFEPLERDDPDTVEGDDTTQESDEDSTQNPGEDSTQNPGEDNTQNPDEESDQSSDGTDPASTQDQASMGDFL